MKTWSVERWLLVLSVMVSCAAFVFGMGVNWAHITEQDARLKAFEIAVNSTFLRGDVYAADQRRLSDSLDRLAVELKMLREQQNQQANARGRMFDR